MNLSVDAAGALRNHELSLHPDDRRHRWTLPVLANFENLSFYIVILLGGYISKQSKDHLSPNWPGIAHTARLGGQDQRHAWEECLLPDTVVFKRSKLPAWGQAQNLRWKKAALWEVEDRQSLKQRGLVPRDVHGRLEVDLLEVANHLGDDSLGKLCDTLRIDP